MKRIGWINGWAVPEDWFRQKVEESFPVAEHAIVAPTPGALDRLEAGGPYDWVAGYSLGSLLLLREAERVSRLGRVVLLAPIFAFPREAGAGGRVARAQLRQLTRWLRCDARMALADFYRRAGLDVAVADGAEFTTAEMGALLWGLEREGVAPGLPDGWCSWCGSADPLLDAAWLRGLSPKIVVVGGVGHDPAGLLLKFAEVVA
jgi:hypothetical protein